MMNKNKVTFKILFSLKDKETCVLLVTTTSMWPLIDASDQVVIERINLEKINKYDVIVFYSYKLQKIIIHRVVKSQKLNNMIVLTTKGDNNTKNDEDFVTEKNFLGKAIIIKDKKINLREYNYFWLSMHFNNPVFIKLKQKLFHFFYNSRINSCF
jgi:signal peptidase I